jgi:hypothetical protein
MAPPRTPKAKNGGDSAAPAMYLLLGGLGVVLLLMVGLHKLNPVDP